MSNGTGPRFTGLRQDRIAIARGSADNGGERDNDVGRRDLLAYQRLVTCIAEHEREARVGAEVKQRVPAVHQIVERSDATTRIEQSLAEYGTGVSRAAGNQYGV